MFNKVNKVTFNVQLTEIINQGMKSFKANVTLDIMATIRPSFINKEITII